MSLVVDYLQQKFFYQIKTIFKLIRYEEKNILQT